MQAPRDSWVTLPEAAPPYPALLDFLDRRFPRVGRDTWRRRLASGAVLTAQGEPVAEQTPYAPRLRLRYRRDVAEEPAIPGDTRILHQDAHLLAADKPHFLPVTPSGPWVNQCLLYGLMRRTGCADLAPLHRLDRETAGVVLFAVDRESRRRYGLLFRTGRVVRRYEAIAALPPDGKREWDVSSRLEKGEPWFRMRETDGPPNARTRIRLIDTRGRWGRYAIAPATGKQHQIRLHMARIGAPIAHDALYPELQPSPKTGYDRPLLLVARAIAFVDPATGRCRRFRSGRLLDWPAD